MNRDIFTPVAEVRPAEDLAELAAEINAEHEAGEVATRQGLEHFRSASASLPSSRPRRSADTGSGCRG